MNCTARRVAIIGCGSIANVHAAMLQQLENVEMVCFVDCIRERAEHFSIAYTNGQAAIYESLSDMLAEEAVDVIHICTPHYLHVPMAIEAMNKGVSFFSEKPPAINMEQFDELCRVYREKRDDAEGIYAGFCFQNRYNETIRIADELVDSGEFGKVTGVRAFVTWRRDEDYYRTDWKGSLLTEGGGALINQSIHTLDLILHYLGKPMDVRASLSNYHLPGVIEVEDTVDAWMTFKNGERACFYATTAYASDAPVIIDIHCERADISIVDKTVTVRSGGRIIRDTDAGGLNGPGKDYWGNGHLACIKDFYEKMSSGERFGNDPEGVRNTMATMMQIYAFGRNEA